MSDRVTQVREHEYTGSESAKLESIVEADSVNRSSHLDLQRIHECRSFIPVPYRIFILSHPKLHP